MHPLTVRTYPGGTIADSPPVFRKTFRTDHKATVTAPAEWLFLLTTVADILPSSLTAILFWALFLLRHIISFSFLPFFFIVSSLHGIIIASVVPSLQAAWLDCCKKYFSAFLRHDIVVVENDSIADLVNIDIESPSQIGADRLVNTIAAWHLNQVRQVVIDFGTAITFDCITDNCTYIGGTIVPGIAISLEALTSRTARLPQVDISAEINRVIGRNTTQAMTSGILHGYGSLVDGMVTRIRQEMNADNQPFCVVATGGMARLIAPYTTTVKQIEPMLTLRGLSIIYRKLTQ